MNIEISRITAVVTSITVAATMAAQDAPVIDPPSDPSPIKVYLLAGQSNMEGKGAVNTLPWLGEDPEHGRLLATIRNGDGSWKEGDGVWIDYLGRRGKLAVGYGSNGSPHGPLIGPEYGFGMNIGDANDAPVLLVKAAWGGKDVAKDFRGPTLGGDDGPGEFYRRTIEHYTSTIAELDQRFPELAGRPPASSPTGAVGGTPYGADPCEGCAETGGRGGACEFPRWAKGEAPYVARSV